MMGFWNWLVANADAVTCLALVPGGLFALWQWHKSCKVTRVEHLRQILLDVKDMEKDGVANTFYECIEREGSGGESVKFYQGKVGGGPCFVKEYEPRIDKMLMYFSLICHEHHLGVINDSEFTYFSYQIHRTLMDKQIKQYMHDLCEFVLSSGKGQSFMFADLVREGTSVDKRHYGEIYKLTKQKSLVSRFFQKCQEVI